MWKFELGSFLFNVRIGEFEDQFFKQLDLHGLTGLPIFRQLSPQRSEYFGHRLAQTGWRVVYKYVQGLAWKEGFENTRLDPRQHD